MEFGRAGVVAVVMTVAEDVFRLVGIGWHYSTRNWPAIQPLVLPTTHEITAGAPKSRSKLGATV